jgi:DNA-directed RNA polymerase subunit F
MASSPITGFVPIPADTIEKWHSQADIDDPPFKRPMLARMAHMKALERGQELEGELRDVAEHHRKAVSLATERAREAVYQVLVCAAFLLGLVLASFAPVLGVEIAAGASAVAFAVLAFSARSRKRELAAAATRGEKEISVVKTQLASTKKEAEEHWGKFVKLQTEADSKIKILEIPDAPVEQK